MRSLKMESCALQKRQQQILQLCYVHDSGNARPTKKMN